MIALKLNRFINKIEAKLVLFMLIMNLFSLSCPVMAVESNLASVSHPKRIASLNLCVDALLLKFAEPERIVSLTHLSENAQFSPFFNQAKSFPKNVGLAEQVVLQQPDLVVAGEFGAGDAKQLLKMLNYRVETLALPRKITDISNHVREFGKIVDKSEEAEAFARTIDLSLEKLTGAARQFTPVNAFWYASNGVVVGDGTLENELMSAAGFHNLALDFGLQGFAPLDLELLLQAKPSAIIIESSDARAFSLASEYLSHPALKQSRLTIVELPKTLSVCIAPIADQVLESLLSQRIALSGISR